MTSGVPVSTFHKLLLGVCPCTTALHRGYALAPSKMNLNNGVILMAMIFLTASNYPNFGHVHWNSEGAEGRPDSQFIQSTWDH